MPIERMDELVDFTGLLLFTAPWCSPCRTYKPLLTGISDRIGLPLQIIDVEESRSLAGAFTVRAVPTTIYVHKGIETARKQGAQTEAGIASLIHLGKR
jgi:thioredoxin-like negative regulator of GroEL